MWHSLCGTIKSHKCGTRIEILRKFAKIKSEAPKFSARKIKSDALDFNARKSNQRHETNNNPGQAAHPVYG
jgi:hypothetical protein